MANPLIDQYQLQQTPYWCGPAAVRDALTCRGVFLTQATLAAELGTTTAGTDSSADVVRVLNQHLGAGSYAARYIPGNDATTAEQAVLKAALVASVDAGWPLVANVVGTIRPLDGGSYSYPGGHYVSVIGYRAGGDEVFVADIAARKYWTTTARLGTWIAERGYAYPQLRVAPPATGTGEGVDYSFDRPDPAGLAAAGKRFAGRYVGPGSGKHLDAFERDALFAAGLDIFLLVEGAAGDAAGGFPVGVDHAQRALAHARALGAPDSTALYFAIDYDVSSKGWDAPREYLRGAGSVIGPSRVGVYGEADVMGWAQRDGVAAWFFPTYVPTAWSQGRTFPGAHVEQYRNEVALAGGTVDLCRSRQANFGQWVRPGGSIPAPIEEDEEMNGIIGQVDGQGIVRAWIDPVLGPVYDNIIKVEYISAWVTMGFKLNPEPGADGNHYPFPFADLAELGQPFATAQAVYFKALAAGGGGAAGGPVTVAADSVAAIADATADEIHADPERDGVNG